MTDMPMGEHTRENMELHIGAAFAGYLGKRPTNSRRSTTP